jgi:hypothetical protein
MAKSKKKVKTDNPPMYETTVGWINPKYCTDKRKYDSRGYRRLEWNKEHK